MKFRRGFWIFSVAFCCALSAFLLMHKPHNAIEHAPKNWQELPGEQRLADLKRRRQAPLKKELQENGFRLGNPAFIRIFKESNELELWLRKPKTSQFEKFKTYPIARWSGELGPKIKEGDGQAPEGVYDIVPKRLNPNSKYHLAFNIGYPNAYDTANDRTGSFIMIHGKDVSIGCFAMTDPVIEELYLVVDAALTTGQKAVPVHSFPFRMTDERLAQAKTENSAWLEFWTMLRPIWQAFGTDHMVPEVTQGKEYVLRK